MDKKKTKVNKNFTKLTHKGVSLIVLIVTIIVIVILAATVILVVSKNNPIESAREARFKEDVRMFQDELNMVIAKEYTSLQGQRDKKITALEYTEKGDKNSVYTYLSSFTKKYENKIGIKEDEIIYVGLDEKEREWLINSGIYMAKKITVHYKDGYGNSIKESEEYPMLDVKYHFEAPEIEGYMVLNEIEEGITSGDREITFEYCMISNDLAFIGLDSNGNETSVESDIAAYTVSGIGECNNPYVAIPREHNGKDVTQIKGSAFNGNNSIKKVVIPESVINVGNRSFQGCPNLTQVNVNATKLGGLTFYNCRNLEKVTIEKNVSNCGSQTFLVCNKLNDLTILSEMLNINNDILGTGSALKEIKINEDNGKYKSVNGIVYSKDGTTIYAYPTGKEGDTYEFSSNIKTVGEYAFNGCKIKYIDIPESVASVGYEAFKGCSNLTQAKVEADKLAYQTFYNCRNLEKVTIGKNVSNCGSQTFLGCNKLNDLTILSEMLNINNDILGTSSALKEIKINEDNGKYKSVNGIVYSKDGTTIYAYPTGKEGDTYEFSSNIKTVGEYAFNGCKIKYIDIPESVASVRYNAFKGCLNLIQAKVDANRLAYQIFYNCSNLEKVTIGKNLSSWERNIFLNCNKLMSINYSGSITEFNNNLNKNNWKSGNSSITTIYCNDGEINL